MTLPRKVWGECYRCPKFPGCNEIAMVCSCTHSSRLANDTFQLQLPATTH